MSSIDLGTISRIISSRYMSIKDLPERRRHIYIGDEPLEFIETCAHCSKPCVYRGRCLQHYILRASEEYVKKQETLRTIATVLAPCLLYRRTRRAVRTTVTTYRA